MPKATQLKLTGIKQGVITIKNPFLGWASQQFNQTQTEGLVVQTIRGNECQYSFSSFINLYRANFLGYIAPGEVFTALADTNTYVDNLPLNAIATSGFISGLPAMFAVMANTKLVSFNESAISAQYTITLADGHVTHSPITSSNNQDCISFKDGTGIEYVLWSWEDQTDADVSIIKPDGTSSDNDWFSTLSGSGPLTKNVPHMMAQGNDGNFYITNGQYIASATGITVAIGSMVGNIQKLNLGPGWVATTLTPFQNFLIIGGYKSTIISGFTQSQCKVWFWDYANPNPNHIFDIPDNYLSALFVDQITQTLYAFTQGADNKTRIKRYNGTNFETAFEHSSAGMGNAPKHGSIDNYNKTICFRQDSGNYGINQWDGQGFHQGMWAGDGLMAVQAAGFIKNLDSNGIYIGTKYGNTYKIARINSNGYTPNACFYSLLYLLPNKSRITAVKLYFSQFGTGASLFTSLYRDYDTNTDLLDLTLTYATHGALREFTIPMNLPNMNTFLMRFWFNHTSATNTAAIIREAEVYFEYVDSKL